MNEQSEEESSEYAESQVEEVAVNVEIAEFSANKNTRLYQLMQKSKGLKMKTQLLQKETIDLDVLFQDLYALIKQMP